MFWAGVLAFCLGGSICFIAVHLIRPAARALGLIDVPDHSRKLHPRPIALVGGLAVFVAFWSVVLLGTVVDGPWQSLLQADARFLYVLFASSLALLGLGLIDDRVPLRGRQKLAGQVAVALILVVAGVTVQSLRVFGLEFELGWFVIPTAVFWFLLTVNSINLLDGMDGVATSVSGVLCMALAAIAFLQGQVLDGLLLLALLGSMAGFLCFNLPPAKIYLGDSGSMLIGALTGTLTLRSLESGLSIFVALALWTIPFADCVAAVVRRKLTARSVYSSDRGHLHHLFQQRFSSNWLTLMGIAAVCLVASGFAVASVVLHTETLALCGAMLLLTFLPVAGWFGRAETQLLLHRVKGFYESLWLFRRDRAPMQQVTFRLQGDYPWQQAWGEFLTSVKGLDLSLIHLDVSMPWVHESFYGMWRRTDTNPRILWRVELPLAYRERVCGRLTVAAQHAPDARQDVVGAIFEHAETLTKLISDAHGEDTQKSGQRVLFVNRSYWPDAESTGQLLTELCQDLAGDFDIEVLAGQPNANPSGAQFRSRGVSVHNNVAIRRVRHTRLAKTSFLFRVTNQITFFLAAGWRLFFIRSPQTIVLQSDPPILCLLGPLLKRWHRAKLVMYLQDIYPDQAIALGWLPDNWRTRLLRKWMFRAFASADQVVVVGRDMQRFLESEGIAAETMACIPNWVDTSMVPEKTENSFRRQHEVDDKFVVMYSGNMGLCHAMEDIVAAAALLRDRTDILFLFIGEGVKKAALQEECERLGLTTTRFLPYQPKEELGRSLSAADLHLVTLDPRVSSLLMPSKLYGAMASETPILAVGPLDGELTQVVDGEHIGLVAPPNDPQRIAEQIEWGADHQEELREMGCRARSLAIRCYDRSESTRKFSEMLHNLNAADSAAPVSVEHTVSSGSL